MDNNMEIDDDPALNLPVLNEDVLFEIFTFLSPCDRKNVKLVCKQWLQICRSKRFVDEKVISISYFYNYPQMKQIIDVFSDRQLNLRFTDRRFSKAAVEFWKEYGSKIESLQFHKCSFHREALPQILYYCVNLREFSMINCKKTYSCVNSDLDGILQLKCNSKEQKNLTVLHMDQNSEAFALTNKQLNFIASVFPKLRSLKILLKNSSAQEDFTALLNLLETRFEHLETVHVNVSYHFPLTSSSLQKFVPTNRLKNVSVSGYWDFENINTFGGLSFKYWFSLTLKHCCISDGALLAQIIDGSPPLRELEFVFTLTTVENFCILWSALIRSRLQFLKIRVEIVTTTINLGSFILQVDSLMNALPKNSTVHRLVVEGDHYGSLEMHFYSLFVKYFQKVDDLCMKLKKLTTNFQFPAGLLSLSLQIQCKNPNLATLKKSVRSLEYLDLQCYSADVFSNYQFPDLKYLRINFHYMDDRWESEISNLELVLARDSPKLEGIQFSCCYIGLRRNVFDPFFRFCRKFRHLRYVCLTYSYKRYLAKRRDLIVELRKCQYYCPSLKAVWLRTPEFSLYYFFNAISRTFEVFSKCNLIAHNETLPVNLKDLWRKERSEIRFI